MSTNRRNFIRNTLLGTGAVSTGIFSRASEVDKVKSFKKHKQRFNMSGYAAPKIDNVRVGFIGLGNRGPGAVKRMSYLKGVEVKALCDLYGDRVEKCQKRLEGRGLPRADSYSGSEDIWKKMVERDDLDLICIATPWDLHTPMAVYAMETGKHAAVEVPAAKTLEECWQLVETSERTQKHCMMLENACYDYFELQTLNMVRQGYFGELVHGEGAYIHQLGFMYKNHYANMWRMKENATRNGNLYPTHGLGPICQAMNINRGEKLNYMVSMQSNDFMLGKQAKELAADDPFYLDYIDKPFRGNMNVSVIKTNKGRTIMLQHDVTSPRPYSRIHLLSGTKAVAQKYPLPGRISNGHEWLDEAGMKELKEKYTPEIVNRMGGLAEKAGGHGGIDFIMFYRLIDCLRNGLPLDQDVYDAALWTAIGPLSEWSVANGSNPVKIPDFTCGSWETNTPFALDLQGGGTTEVHEI